MLGLKLIHVDIRSFWCPVLRIQNGEISIEFKLRAKVGNETGSWQSTILYICGSGVMLSPFHRPLSRYANCGLCMRRACRERFPRHRLQRKPLASDPGMHHDTCVTHVPWCMSGSLTRDGGENVPGIPGAGETRNFTYLVKGPCRAWLLCIVSDHVCYYIYELIPFKYNFLMSWEL